MVRPSWRPSLTALTAMLAGCVLLAGSLAAAPGDKGEKGGKPAKGKGGKVTKANYDKLKKDMTEKAVVALLGEPTKTASREVPQFGKVKEAVWKGGKDEILVLFKAEKLIHKQSTFGALQPKGGKVNKESYQRIKEGMTEKEVLAILGPPTSVNMAAIKTLLWRDGDNLISVVFKDGKVKSKGGQFGK